MWTSRAAQPLELGAIVVAGRPPSSQAGAGEFGEILVLGDCGRRGPPGSSRSPAVPMKPTGFASAFSAAIPASPLVATKS